MSDVGGIDVTFLRGLPSPLKTRLDVWEVPGLDGYGAQKLGMGDGEFEITTVLYAEDDDEADTHIDECVSLQGVIGYFTDDFGTTYGPNLIVHVDTAGSKRPMIWDGNANAVRTEIRWKMLSMPG